MAKNQADWTLVSYVMIAVGAVLFVWYLLGVNAYASKGFEIKQIQNNISALTEANKKLNLSLSEKYSIATIQEDFAKNNFVPAGQPQYLGISQLTER